MTVKELKSALQGINEPINRIAGFCDNYDQMFDHCEVRVNENTLVRIFSNPRISSLLPNPSPGFLPCP